MCYSSPWASLEIYSRRFPPSSWTETSILHSWFNISSGENFRQLLFMTNTYVSLEQVSVTTRSGNFLWELKYYYLPNVANCTLKSDSLSTKNSVFFGEYGFTHSSSASSSAYLVNSVWHDRKEENFLWYIKCAFSLQTESKQTCYGVYTLAKK